MSARGPHVCPRCGTRVSAFAAGCAVCGAPLDPHRAERPPTLLSRLRSRRRRGQRLGEPPRNAA